jgi:O-antigen/teichoic acid export membrane protein
VIIVFAAMTLIVESRGFLTLWIGSDFAAKSSELLILHTITFSALALLTVSWRMMEGLGRTEYNFIIFVLTFVVAMSLFFFLTPLYGLVGVAAARLVGFTIILFSIWNVERIVFGKILWRFWANIGTKLAAATVIAAIIQISIIRLLSLSWISFIAAVSLSAVCYFAILFLLGFVDADDRIMLKGMLGKYVK